MCGLGRGSTERKIGICSRELGKHCIMGWTVWWQTGQIEDGEDKYVLQKAIAAFFALLWNPTVINVTVSKNKCVISKKKQLLVGTCGQILIVAWKCLFSFRDETVFTVKWKTVWRGQSIDLLLVYVLVLRVKSWLKSYELQSNTERLSLLLPAIEIFNF